MAVFSKCRHRHEVVEGSARGNGGGLTPRDPSIGRQNHLSPSGPLSRDLISHGYLVPLYGHARSFAIIDQQASISSDGDRRFKTNTIPTGAEQPACVARFAVENQRVTIGIQFHAEVIVPIFRGCDHIRRRPLDGLSGCIWPHDPT